MYILTKGLTDHFDPGGGAGMTVSDASDNRFLPGIRNGRILYETKFDEKGESNGLDPDFGGNGAPQE